MLIVERSIFMTKFISNMKNILFLFTLVVFSCSNEVIIINESTFPDYSFRSFVLSKWYGKDGKLTSSEIKEITEIDVDNLNIKDLKGIEYFTSLGTLSCKRNYLTSIDLSNNTEIWRLFCSENNESWGQVLDS